MSPQAFRVTGQAYANCSRLRAVAPSAGETHNGTDLQGFYEDRRGVGVWVTLATFPPIHEQWR